MKAVVVDLFCGAGGLTHGFLKEDIEVAAGIDSDPSCKYPYETNNNAAFLNKSIELLKAEELEVFYRSSDVSILVGCAPCQPFSAYSNKKSADEKWKLLYEFSRLTKELKPDIVSMENVPQLKNHEVFSEFVKTLETNGYSVSWYIVYCPDYGIPQMRRRLVLFASKFGKINLIERTHKPEEYRNVRDTIYGLNRIRDGRADPEDPLHRASKLSKLNKKRIMATPKGGDWRDWPIELRLKCHRKRSGKSYRNVYGRMNWDKPAPTITTQCTGIGNGRFGHPVQNRAISLREAALLQTFPKYYKFVDPNSEFCKDNVARHIGNAVPVTLGRVIARSIKNHLKMN